MLCMDYESEIKIYYYYYIKSAEHLDTVDRSNMEHYVHNNPIPYIKVNKACMNYVM